MNDEKHDEGRAPANGTETRSEPVASAGWEPPEGYRYFVTERIDSVVIARVIDRFLHGDALAEMIRLELAQIVDASACKILIIDVTNVRMITSSVICALLLLQSHLAARDIALRLCSMSESIRDVFKMMNLDQTLAIYDSVDDAVSDQGRVRWYSDVCDRVSPPDDD